MTREYEFAYQSITQKAVLAGLKLLIILLLINSLYSLGWHEDADTVEKLRRIGSVLFCFWVYANLLRVKIEVQELFVPPMNILHAAEFMLVGVAMAVVDTLYTIYQIIVFP